MRIAPELTADCPSRLNSQLANHLSFCAVYDASICFLYFNAPKTGTTGLAAAIKPT